MARDGIVTVDESAIDGLLAAVLRGEAAAWPSDWRGSRQAELMSDRIAYHGVAGLIAAEARALVSWPAAVIAAVREQAIALAMWELRHKAVLGELLAALAEERILALLLKGTALAYDLYATPSARARGDTDILIAPSDLRRARSIFARLNYRCQPLDEGLADDLALQEIWSLEDSGGTAHDIDLHWQTLNAPTLRSVLEFRVCAADPLPLPLLAPDALAMNRVLTLLHICIHRAMHLTSPYFVNGVTYYGGERLIWAKDIDLLARVLSDEDWQKFRAAALDQGVAAVSLNGLIMAERSLGTAIPQAVLDDLAAAGAEPASAYLLGSRQMGRAWQDLRAIRQWNRKLAYLAARALPSASFMRAKYPEHGRLPLAVLHIRRVVDLIRPRPNLKTQR